MAIRPTLTTMVSRLRRMVGDRDSALWTDSEIADTLGKYRSSQRQIQVPGIAERGLSGAQVYYEYRAGVYGEWEDGATLFDRNGSPIETSRDFTSCGIWTFATPQDASYIYVTGSTYCLNSAAVELLKERLALRVGRVDTRDKDQEKKYSQESSQIKALIAQYEANIPATTLQAVRNDVYVR